MRSEQEVLNQILEFAKTNHKVKVVLHNGSRVNPNIKKDIFCDYDIAFSVTDIAYFVKNQDWINNFGELIIMQHNLMYNEGQEWHFFLMLFNDGVRIDLSFNDVKHIESNLDDSLTKVLLDKDSILPKIDPPTEKSYYFSKPTNQEYIKLVNNILWCSTYVAKGLWRNELPYVKYMLDVIVRNDIVKLLNWYVGTNYNWKVNTGTAGKWLEKYLPEEIWKSFVKTYAGADYYENWDALLESLKLTNVVGKMIAQELGYEYPIGDTDRVNKHITRVRKLPKDAIEYR